MNPQPGKHFTLISNLGCSASKVRVFETLDKYRNKTNILTKRNADLLKLLTGRTGKKLKVKVVNVRIQEYHGRFLFKN